VYRGFESLDDFEKAITERAGESEENPLDPLGSNEQAARMVALAVVGLAMYAEVAVPGTANAVLTAVGGLLEALAAVVMALRSK
jgi:hypothetical protein